MRATCVCLVRNAAARQQVQHMAKRPSSRARRTGRGGKNKKGSSKSATPRSVEEIFSSIPSGAAPPTASALPPLPHYSSKSSNERVRSKLVEQVPVLPPIEFDADTEEVDEELATGTSSIHSSGIFASSPADDKDLVQAAQALRSVIQQCHDDPGQILPTFIKQHPEQARIIRRHGGIKAVSRLMPHMYSWAPGQLTAPPDGPQRDKLQRVAENTRIMTLCDAFLLDGGSTANMNRFEREQCDEDGNCLPKVVAVDVEGTHLVPPILIQICPIIGSRGENGSSKGNNSKVYLEQPRRRTSYAGGSQLSDALKDLLADESVLKVFFDGDGDMNSLGAPVNNAICLQREIGVSRGMHGRKNLPSLIDMANHYMAEDVADDEGKNSSQHNIRYLYRKNRTLQKWFGNRKRPGRKLHDKLLWYGAADAWATAKIYEGMERKRSKYEETKRKQKQSNSIKDVVEDRPRLTSAQIQAELERRAAEMVEQPIDLESDGDITGNQGGKESFVTQARQFLKRLW